MSMYIRKANENATKIQIVRRKRRSVPCFYLFFLSKSTTFESLDGKRWVGWRLERHEMKVQLIQNNQSKNKACAIASSFHMSKQMDTHTHKHIYDDIMMARATSN